MLLSTATFLAICSLVAAAPAVENKPRGWENCIDAWDPLGRYLDNGCGTPIALGSNNNLCLSSQWNTTPQSGLRISPCRIGTQDAPTEDGGRWRLTIGGTQIVLKQSRTGDYCLTVKENNTVGMSICSGQPSQSWTVSRTQIKVADKNLCLTFANMSVYLTPCIAGAIDQTWTLTGSYSFYDMKRAF